MILQKKKVKLDKYLTTRNNPDYSLGIYLIASKLGQYILLAENSSEKEVG